MLGMFRAASAKFAPTLEWETVRTPHFRVHYPPSYRRFTAYLAAYLEEAFADGDPALVSHDMVQRILRTAFAAGVIDDPPLGRVVDPFKGAASAQRIAEQSSVLLKNAPITVAFHFGAALTMLACATIVATAPTRT